jgi:transposase-like protein
MAYKREDKEAAVALLRANGFSVGKTAKALRERGLGVCRQTLYAWRSDALAPALAPALPAAAEPLQPPLLLPQEVADEEGADKIRQAGKEALHNAVRLANRRILEEGISNKELSSLLSVLNAITSRADDDESPQGHADVMSLIVNQFNG